MFYLRFLSTNFLKNPIRFTLFLFFSVLIFMVSGVKSLSSFFDLGGSAANGRYFYVISDGARIGADVEKQIRNLPGVARFDQEPEEKVRSDLNKIFSGLNGQINDLLSKTPPQVFQLILSKEVNHKGENLIKEYIRKIVGEEFISFSITKDPSKIIQLLQNKVGEMDSVARPIALIGIFLLWLFSLLNLLAVMVPRSFVVENYQGKIRVTFKTLGVLYPISLVTGFFISLILGAEVALDHILITSFLYFFFSYLFNNFYRRSLNFS